MTDPSPLISTDLDPAALTALLAEIAAADDPKDPRAALVRALFRADEVAVVHDPLGAGAMLRQALSAHGGTWVSGAVTGSLEAAGWAAAMGVKAVRWDPAGEPLAVQALRAPTLPPAWGMLDGFALGDYRRILVPVLTADERLWVGNLYALK
ncbi:MAG: hypothetical protein AAFW46_02665 [Pseudomonadota bacterium]